MRRWIGFSIAVASASMGAAAAAVPPPPPPPISVAPSARTAGNNDRQLLMWHPSEARCDDGVATPATLHRPLNELVWERGVKPEAVSYGFEIDASGRTLSIARIGEGSRRLTDDLAPSLAASRFAPGRPQTGCIVTFTPETASLDAAPIPELMSYSMNRKAQRLPREGLERIGAGGNCTGRPRAAALLRAFPDFDALPATPGARDWAMVGYDLDASGVPFDERIVTGTGNAALDRASLKAVADSRFSRGPRTGCLYPYWRSPAVLEAPPMPPRGAPGTEDSVGCADRAGFAVKPRLIFPDDYRRRSIEGWAIVRYDVAPWGEIGRVEVIEAQPSEDFGKQAVQMLRMAKARTSGAGMTGCVDRVRFRMKSYKEPTAKAEPITVY